MNVPRLRLVETEPALILVLLINHVLSLLLVQLITIARDVNAHQDMKEMGIHPVQRLESENVNTTLIVLITEHVYNTNV